MGWSEWDDFPLEEGCYEELGFHSTPPLFRQLSERFLTFTTQMMDEETHEVFAESFLQDVGDDGGRMTSKFEIHQAGEDMLDAILLSFVVLDYLRWHEDHAHGKRGHGGSSLSGLDLTTNVAGFALEVVNQLLR